MCYVQVCTIPESRFGGRVSSRFNPHAVYLLDYGGKWNSMVLLKNMVECDWETRTGGSDSMIDSHVYRI